MLHWKRYYMNLHFQSAEGAALVSIFAREKFLKVKFGASLFQEMRSLTYMDAAPAWNALCIVPEHKYIKRGILNKEFQDLCRWTFLKWNRRLDNHVNQAIILHSFSPCFGAGLQCYFRSSSLSLQGNFIKFLYSSDFQSVVNNNSFKARFFKPYPVRLFTFSGQEEE